MDYKKIYIKDNEGNSKGLLYESSAGFHFSFLFGVKCFSVMLSHEEGEKLIGESMKKGMRLEAQ